MNINKESKRFVLRLLGLAAAALLCLGTWATAGGPIADFPSFIPFAGTAKTGDVAVDKVGNVYVNVTQSNGSVAIWEFSPAGEGPFVVANIGWGVAYGLAVDADGDIYAAITGTNRGVYRVDRHGNVVLLPGTDNIVAANAMAFDKRGNLFVTESSSASGQGGIWRIPREGEAELMLRDVLLTGTDPNNPIGANGIAYYHGDLYVVNCDKGFIVRIPVHPDGGLGQPDIWTVLEEVTDSLLAGSPFPIKGDGIALDVHGNVYVAMVTRLAVVRINVEDMSQETIAVFDFNPNASLFAPLDMPNSLAFGTGKGGRQRLFVTNLGWMINYVPQLPPGLSWPGPGLMKIEAGEPGLPLP
jgi:sugar lactone lactonase YvrE